SAFAQLDAPALLSLPAQPYELARFKTVTVHIEHRHALSFRLDIRPGATTGFIAVPRGTTPISCT
ncbi:hypothetical protein SAMN06295900_1291, partial [Trinickia caryophylli]